jgi:L-lactate dehydrogenase complex protein LldF
MAQADLHARLAGLLGGMRETWESATGGGEGALSRQTVLSAAVPAEGWPADLREMVESTLGNCGFHIVSPRRTGEGFEWDRTERAGAILGVSFCGSYLADTGSLVAPAGRGSGTLATLLPEVHLALSYPEGCLADLGEYLANLGTDLPSRFTLITGPSRTGDIEATMTTGVHGPREVHHWIIADASRGTH